MRYPNVTWRTLVTCSANFIIAYVDSTNPCHARPLPGEGDWRISTGLIVLLLTPATLRRSWSCGGRCHRFFSVTGTLHCSRRRTSVYCVTRIQIIEAIVPASVSHHCLVTADRLAQFFIDKVNGVRAAILERCAADLHDARRATSQQHSGSLYWRCAESSTQLATQILCCWPTTDVCATRGGRHATLLPFICVMYNVSLWEGHLNGVTEGCRHSTSPEETKRGSWRTEELSTNLKPYFHL